MNIKVTASTVKTAMFPVTAEICGEEYSLTKQSAKYLRDQLTEALEKLNG